MFEVTDFYQIITDQGLSIAFSIAIGVFCYQLIMMERKENETREEKMWAMFEGTLTTVKLSVDNNTRAVQELKEMIKEKGF